MRYFGLNHRPSTGVNWKLNELRGTFTLESQINTDYEIKQSSANLKISYIVYYYFYFDIFEN